MKIKSNNKIIGKKIYHLKSIDSTNLFSKNLINDGAEEGTVVVADVQTGGRGRKNRMWFSPKGGLWFSIILYPNVSPDSGMFVTMLGSISVAQAISELTGLDPEIKWPNDVLINRKKVCGILTEMDIDQGKLKSIIIGIGINVNNQLNEELQNIATNLKKETNNEISKENLLELILKKFDKNYDKLQSDNYNYVKDRWLFFSNIIGKKIKVNEDGKITIGTVSDINRKGHLIINSEKVLITITTGDIEYL